MKEQQSKQDQALDNTAQRLTGWMRFVGVVFRILIVLGVILTVLAVVALISTAIFKVWILLLPISLIFLGVLLAWIEYQLYDRLYACKHEDSIMERETEDNRAQ